MESAIIVIFGISGGILGLLIPEIIHGITKNKCRKKGIAPDKDRLHGSIFFRIAVCILNAAGWAVVGLRADNMLFALIISVLLSMAVVITAIDLQIRLIPNELVLAMIVLGAVYRFLSGGLSALLISLLCMAGMVVLFSAAAWITGFGTIGAGDVKLAGAMGAVLGYPEIMIALGIMSAALVVYSSAGLITRKLTLKSTLAFAPFLMLGMAFSLARMILIG